MSFLPVPSATDALMLNIKNASAVFYTFVNFPRLPPSCIQLPQFVNVDRLIALISSAFFFCSANSRNLPNSCYALSAA